MRRRQGWDSRCRRVFQAIGFDVFRTLIDTEQVGPTRYDTVALMAAVPGSEHEGFAIFWADTYVERETS